jgi:hypothetical protein
MEKQNHSLTDEEKNFLNKIISPRSLYLFIHQEIIENKGAAFVRFADGDFEVIKSVKENFSLEKKYGIDWINDLGLQNVDLNKISDELIYAGNNAKYIAPSISAINYETFKGSYFFKDRKNYFDIFSFYDFNKEMIKEIYESADGVGVITRQAEYFSKKIKNKFNTHTEYFTLNNRNDIKLILNKIQKSSLKLFIVMGGPIAKFLATKIQELGKICIDVGRSIENWS